jgi:hypothetical protein
MTRVVVAGSENDVRFTAINFTMPTSPTVVLVDPGFGAGCRIATDSSSAVAGSVLTGNVRLIEVSNPALPALKGNINTMLSGIGAIAIRGSRVAVGEYVNSFKARVTLISFSSPMSPIILGTAQTPLINVTTGTDSSAAISSIAFLSDNVLLVSGPSAGIVVKVDFSNPVSPIVTTFNPVVSGGASIDVDASANRLAVGDNNSTILKLFDATENSLLGTANTTLGGVISVALKNPMVLAGSPNNFNVVRVNFSGTPSVTPFDPGLGGGSSTAIEGTIGACGGILGTQVKLIDLAPTTPTVVGTANAMISSISSLAISTF